MREAVAIDPHSASGEISEMYGWNPTDSIDKRHYKLILDQRRKLENHYKIVTYFSLIVAIPPHLFLFCSACSTISTADPHSQQFTFNGSFSF